MLVQPVRVQWNVPVHQAIRVHHAKVSWLLVLLFAIKTTKKYPNAIGYHQPDLITNRAVYASCF